MGVEIPTKTLKECEFTFEILTQRVNKSFGSGEFPDCLKQANVSPIFKKDDPLDKENYRPECILPLLQKVNEKLLYNQLSDYVENCFNVKENRLILQFLARYNKRGSTRVFTGALTF